MKPDQADNAPKPFDRRDTAFARERRDEMCAAHGVEQRSGEPTADGRAGYRREDFALGIGARTMAGSYLEPSPAEGDGRGDVSDTLVFTRQVKQAARLYGASLVGVARVNPAWLYADDDEQKPSERLEGLGTVLVMAHEMDFQRMRTSPSAVASSATGLGYSHMAMAASSAAKYLAQLGWRAVPCGNDTALSVPLAIDAGLGEAGRNGQLITIPYGPRVRLSKVFTDAPLVPDKPIAFGVREFCGRCTKCARWCPSGSIPKGPMTTSGPSRSNHSGTLKWYTNPETCLAFWRKNGISCANCIRSCPFNKPPGRLHALARWLIRYRSTRVNRLLLLLDEALGYGTNRDARRALRKLGRVT